MTVIDQGQHRHAGLQGAHSQAALQELHEGQEEPHDRDQEQELDDEPAGQGAAREQSEVEQGLPAAGDLVSLLEAERGEHEQAGREDGVGPGGPLGVSGRGDERVENQGQAEAGEQDRG